MSLFTILLLVWFAGALVVVFLEGLLDLSGACDDGIVAMTFFWPIVLLAALVAAPFVLAHKAGKLLAKWGHRR